MSLMSLEEKRDKEIRRRTGGRSARIREAVLEATLAIAGRGGFASLSVGEIARVSGVHETTIYRRWGSVERLVLDTILDRIDTEIPQSDTGSLRGDLTASMRSAIAFFATPLGMLLLKALVAVGTEENALKREYWRSRMLSIQPVLDRARARGELAPGQDGVLLFQAVIGAIYLRYFVTGEIVEPGLAERIVEAVLGPSKQSA
jgi:AcrR family transcriptional regulator